jgi:hypothetical protein
MECLYVTAWIVYVDLYYAWNRVSGVSSSLCIWCILQPVYLRNPQRMCPREIMTQQHLVGSLLNKGSLPRVLPTPEDS